MRHDFCFKNLTVEDPALIVCAACSLSYGYCVGFGIDNCAAKPTIIDIHPLDMADILANATDDIRITRTTGTCADPAPDSLITYGDVTYRQTVNAPRIVKLEDNIANSFDNYGKWAESMWFSRDPEDKEMGERDLAIMGLGIAGEAGEVVEKIKKDIRDHFVDKHAILKELGDVIFYAITIARYYGFKPSDILRANYEKLTSRRARGTERGSGDNR